MFTYSEDDKKILREEGYPVDCNGMIVSKNAYLTIKYTWIKYCNIVCIISVLLEVIVAYDSLNIGSVFHMSILLFIAVYMVVLIFILPRTISIKEVADYCYATYGTKCTKDYKDGKIML